MGDLRPESLVALEAARRGLQVAHARVGASDIRSKGGLDIVTGTDIAAEEAIKLVLGEQFHYPVIGEESGGEAAPGYPCWLVDPICGTRNFASHLAIFSVNVALIEGVSATCSAVGDGATGDVYVAQHGTGAFAIRGTHARRLRASPDSRTIVIEGWPSEKEQRGRYARFMSAVAASERWELRSFGSTVSLAYLAAARISAYVLFSVSPVHPAAGALLAEEAGAKVTGLDGHPWSVSSESLVAAASPELHEEVMELLEAS